TDHCTANAGHQTGHQPAQKAREHSVVEGNQGGSRKGMGAAPTSPELRGRGGCPLGSRRLQRKNSAPVSAAKGLQSPVDFVAVLVHQNESVDVSWSDPRRLLSAGLA